MSITYESHFGLMDCPEFSQVYRSTRRNGVWIRYADGREADRILPSLQSAIRQLESVIKNLDQASEDELSDISSEISSAVSDLSAVEEQVENLISTAENFESWGDEWKDLAIGYWSDYEPDDYWITKGFMNAQSLNWKQRLTPDAVKVRLVQMKLESANRGAA